MERTLTKSARKGQATVLLPGATEAEPWELWAVGDGARLLQAGAKPEDLAPARDTVQALPAAEVMALPLWLLETDPKQFDGIIALQLEARGLNPRGGEPVFNWSIVVQEEKRTLVLVGVLPTSLPEELETHSCPGFDAAARCFQLPADALVLWLEQDRLALAVTRGARLAYFQALADATLTPRVWQDLACIVAALRMQGVAGQLDQVCFWADAPLPGAAELAFELGLRLVQEARPAPVLPRESWKLTPARVHAVKLDRAARRWWMRGAALAVLLAVGTAGAFGLRLALAARAANELRQWQAAHAAELDTVQDTRAAWADLQPVVDTGSYPLEILLPVSQSLPANEVHLTLFQSGGGHVLIKAEAENLTAAYRFFDQLKKNPALASYSWAMAQPHSLANDVTQLQIEGTHATHD